MDRTRNRYDSSLICLYALGREAIVPQHVREQVPHSTASTWRHLDTTLFVGHELRDFHGEAIDHYALLCKYRLLKRTVCTLQRVWDRVASTVLPVLQRTRSQEELYVGAVQQMADVMPFGRALRIARLSATAFRARITRIRERCGLSVIGTCFQRHPLQLSVGEVRKLKALFHEPAYALWPAASLFYQGRRAHGLHLSRSTFYKYVRALGLHRPRPKAALQRHGIRATAPNQYLHMDTTHWKVDADHTLSIAIVSDNFSRAVLGFSIALNKGAANVLEALKQALATMVQHHPHQQHVLLVSDDGGENKAGFISDLVVHNERPLITHLIAQQDIRFSNSPVEAVNKILKGYLRQMRPQGVAATEEAIRWALHDYTHDRPHGSIGGLTPFERYLHPELVIDDSAQRRMAQALRIAANRGKGCGTCA